MKGSKELEAAGLQLTTSGDRTTNPTNTFFLPNENKQTYVSRFVIFYYSTRSNDGSGSTTKICNHFVSVIHFPLITYLLVLD